MARKSLNSDGRGVLPRSLRSMKSRTGSVTTASPETSKMLRLKAAVQCHTRCGPAACNISDTKPSRPAALIDYSRAIAWP